jgi:hypothetical protein
MMVRFDLSTSMDAGHDGDDPAHPLEKPAKKAIGPRSRTKNSERSS